MLGPLLICIGDRHLSRGSRDLLDAGLGLHLDPLLFQNHGQALGNLPVHKGQDVVCRLQHGDFAAQAVVNGGTLHPHHTAADDDQGGNLPPAPFQQIPAVVDPRQIYAGNGGIGDLGPGGDDNILSLIGLPMAGNHAGPLDAGRAADHGDLIGLHQLLHPLPEGLHHLVLPPVHGGKVIGYPLGLDAQGLGMLQGRIGLRAVEQGLGGHAAPVQAGASQVILLKQDHLHPRFRGFLRGGVPTGAAADDRNVVLHVTPPP